MYKVEVGSVAGEWFVTSPDGFVRKFYIESLAQKCCEHLNSRPVKHTVRWFVIGFCDYWQEMKEAEVTEVCFSSLTKGNRAEILYERHTMHEHGVDQICLTVYVDSVDFTLLDLA